MDLTYSRDVAPHLRRALAIRARRDTRYIALHRHDGRAISWLVATPSLLLFWALITYGVHIALG